SVEHIGNGRRADVPDRRVPQRRAVFRAQRDGVARGVPREEQAGRRRQHARAGAAAAQIVRPSDLAGLIVDRLEPSLAEHAVVGPCPAVVAVFGLEEIDAVVVSGADDEQPRFRIEAWGSVVREAALGWRDETAVALRLLVWIRNRLPLL